MSLQTLDQWIAEAAADTEKEGDITLMSLVHAKGLAEQEIHTIKMGTAKKWTPKELAEVFRKKAENHAAELSGVQLYHILVFYGNRTEPQARKPFRVNSSTDLDVVGGTEGPTGTGLTQQAMRHTEAIFQIATRQMSGMFHQMAELNQKLADTVLKQNRELSDAQSIVFKLMTDKLNNDFDRQMKIEKAERTTALIKKGVELLPAVINQVTGKEVLPQSSSDTAMINAIADEMTVEKYQALVKLNLVPPHLMGMLMARFEKREKEKIAEAESKHRIANGITPEDEAN
jgi:hypothetical protein